MKKLLLSILFIAHVALVTGQACPQLSNPRNGFVDVPVNTTISWPQVPGIIGYKVSLGLTLGGEEILGRRSAGITNSYTPEVGLPENTTIYVTIELELSNGELIRCPSESFTTEEVTTPPPCTTLAEPADNQGNVSVKTEIAWAYAPRATGYRLSIGTAAGASDLLDNFDVGNVLTYNPTGDFPQDSDIFVTITPYNEIGDAGSCTEESFTTGNAIVDCNAYFDPVIGEIVPRKPESDFPPQIGLCRNEIPTRIATKDTADGFRWYKINEDGSESLLSSTSEVLLSEVGPYRYEAYNFIDQGGETFECGISQDFTVVLSELAQITSVSTSQEVSGRQIEVEVNGLGDYEYALDNIDGPYQNSSIFTGVSEGIHTIYVNDRNGCGIAERIIERELSPDDFPKFFTPNGDGINDFWQYIAPREQNEIQLTFIQVFDRYGVLLAQIMPNSRGWDGTFNGQPLPASSYWFKARDNLNNEIQGFFALKR
ncbi:T9SS type B sorting domain-containing protein [Eudoraea adriatica]|uniref:T9SS type B sorting domain-containing protein n=1 Tax=Eudoraea adriatica TaxID=446681 RepID=UPI00037A410F|nr:T9SS type B sorting domain-containing protein [Eudoraea adriatica]